MIQLKGAFAQIARKIDPLNTLALNVELKLSFIVIVVLDCLSKTHSIRSLSEVIMALLYVF